VLFSGLTRTPLWSAEHLTAQRVRNSRGDTRVNSFHPDPGLPPGIGAEMSDYARSGYDRGHMAPSGDMPDPRSQDESFSLANMIPQDPDHNRRLWSAVEAGVRDVAVESGEVYVVTGPIFTGSNVQSLRGRVLIPTHVFKAVYDPRRRAGAAYLATNAAGQDARVITLAELERISGIDPFPGVSDAEKDTALSLPVPRQPRRRRVGQAAEPGPAPDPSTTGGVVEGILADIDHLPRRP
jgi:endonuclease G